MDWQSMHVHAVHAKQHDKFVCTIALGVLVSTLAGSWLDEITWKLVVKCFSEDLSKPQPVPQAESWWQVDLTPLTEQLTMIMISHWLNQWHRLMGLKNNGYGMVNEHKHINHCSVIFEVLRAHRENLRQIGGTTRETTSTRKMSCWLGDIIIPGYPIDGNRWSKNQSILSIKLVNWYRLVLVNRWSIDNHTKTVHRLVSIGTATLNRCHAHYVSNHPPFSGSPVDEISKTILTQASLPNAKNIPCCMCTQITQLPSLPFRVIMSTRDLQQGLYWI